MQDGSNINLLVESSSFPWSRVKAVQLSTQCSGIQNTCSRWNEPALKVAYHQGLDPVILTILACNDKQKSLDSLNDLSICLDQLLHNCQVPKLAVRVFSDISPTESMQTGQAKLTAMAYKWHKRSGLYSGDTQHPNSQCPLCPQPHSSQPQKHSSSIFHSCSNSSQHLTSRYNILSCNRQLSHSCRLLLNADNPHTSWSKRETISWSPQCLDTCLCVPVVMTASTTIKSQSQWPASPVSLWLCHWPHACNPLKLHAQKAKQCRTISTKPSHSVKFDSSPYLNQLNSSCHMCSLAHPLFFSDW